MKTFEKAEIVASLISDKSDEIQTLKLLLDEGIISDDSKIEQLEAQLELLQSLEA